MNTKRVLLFVSIVLLALNDVSAQHRYKKVAQTSNGESVSLETFKEFLKVQGQIPGEWTTINGGHMVFIWSSSNGQRILFNMEPKSYQRLILEELAKDNVVVDDLVVLNSLEVNSDDYQYQNTGFDPVTKTLVRVSPMGDILPGFKYFCNRITKKAYAKDNCINYQPSELVVPESVEIEIEEYEPEKISEIKVENQDYVLHPCDGTKIFLGESTAGGRYSKDGNFWLRNYGKKLFNFSNGKAEEIHCDTHTESGNGGAVIVNNYNYNNINTNTAPSPERYREDVRYTYVDQQPQPMGRAYYATPYWYDTPPVRQGWGRGGNTFNIGVSIAGLFQQRSFQPQPVNGTPPVLGGGPFDGASGQGPFDGYGPPNPNPGVIFGGGPFDR